MDYQKILESRYAVRNFDENKVISDEVLYELLSIIPLAPSAVNHQSPRVYVIKSPLGLNNINELCTCLSKANTVLMFTYNKDEEWKNPFDNKYTSGQQDVSILATMLMLKAVDLGLGSCWVNFFDNEKVKSTFRLPSEEEVVLLMPIGYMNEDSEPNPIMHKKRKELPLMVRYL